MTIAKNYKFGISQLVSVACLKDIKYPSVIGRELGERLEEKLLEVIGDYPVGSAMIDITARIVLDPWSEDDGK